LAFFVADEIVRLKEETDAAQSTEVFNATGINDIKFGITIQPLVQSSEAVIGKQHI
jgi:hypothetical protein